MSTTLIANNKSLISFHMSGAWPHLLEQCGAYFTAMFRGPRWFMTYDERMTTHSHYPSGEEEKQQIRDRSYPSILCGCGGFEVTEEESKVLARIARNYAAIQRTIEEPSEEEQAKIDAMPDYRKPFPMWIQRPWVETYEQFAEWAEQSQGFKI